MTKFEQVGINFQQTSRTKEEAMQRFEHSCNICCYRGMHIDCDKCGIAVCNKMVIATFEPRKGGENNAQ